MSLRSRQLVRATTVVMGLYVLSRVAGLARDIVISRAFGTSPQLDAYLAAFRIPDLIFNVIAGGALTSALIPTFAALLTSQQREAAWRLASSILTLCLVVVTLAAGAAALLAEPLVGGLIAPGFGPEQKALAVNLMRLMLVTPIIWGISGTVMGILNSFHHFALPALAPTVYNLAIIGAALGLAPALGVYGLALGVVIGALLHLAIQIPMMLHQGGVFRLQFGLADPNVREVGRLMLPRMIGLATVQINFVVNTILASGLPAGSISSLDYAFRLMLLPEAIVAQAIATTVFPSLSALAAERDRARMRELFSNALRATLFLAVPASVGLIVLRVPVTQLLFQRGAFDAESTRQVAWALQFFALGLFAHAGLEIIARAFYALHDTATPVKIGFGAMGLNIVMSLLFAGPLQHGGLALANSLATILEMLALLLLLRVRLGGIDGARLARAVGRMAVAALVMGLLVEGFMALLQPAWWVAALAGLPLGAIVYLGAAWLLGSEEMQLGWQIARGRVA